MAISSVATFFDDVGLHIVCTLMSRSLSRVSRAGSYDPSRYVSLVATPSIPQSISMKKNGRAPVPGPDDSSLRHRHLQLTNTLYLESSADRLPNQPDPDLLVSWIDGLKNRVDDTLEKQQQELLQLRISVKKEDLKERYRHEVFLAPFDKLGELLQQQGDGKEEVRGDSPYPEEQQAGSGDEESEELSEALEEEDDDDIVEVLTEEEEQQPEESEEEDEDEGEEEEEDEHSVHENAHHSVPHALHPELSQFAEQALGAEEPFEAEDYYEDEVDLDMEDHDGEFDDELAEETNMFATPKYQLRDGRPRLSDFPVQREDEDESEEESEDESEAESAENQELDQASPGDEDDGIIVLSSDEEQKQSEAEPEVPTFQPASRLQYSEYPTNHLADEPEHYSEVEGSDDAAQVSEQESEQESRSENSEGESEAESGNESDGVSEAGGNEQTGFESDDEPAEDDTVDSSKYFATANDSLDNNHFAGIASEALTEHVLLDLKHPLDRMLSDYLADVESDGGAFKPSSQTTEPMPIFDHNQIETPAPEKFDLGTLSADKKSEDPSEGSMADADTDKVEETQESDVPPPMPSIPVFRTVTPDSPNTTLQQLKATEKRFGIKLDAVKDLEAELGLPHSTSSDSESEPENFVDAPAYQPLELSIQPDSDAEESEEKADDNVEVNMEEALQSFIEEVQLKDDSKNDHDLHNLGQSIDNVSSRLANEAVEAYLKNVKDHDEPEVDPMEVDKEEEQTNDRHRLHDKIPKVTVHTLDVRSTDTPSDDESQENNRTRPGFHLLKLDSRDGSFQQADQHNDTDDSLSYVSAIETENSSTQASRQASSVSIQLVNNKELPFEVIKKAQKDPRHIVPISVDQDGEKYEMAPCPVPGGYNVTLKEVSSLDNKEPSMASLSSIIVHPPQDSIASAASTATSITNNNDQEGRHLFGAASAHAGHGNSSGDDKDTDRANANASAEAGSHGKDHEAHAIAEADANKSKDGEATATAEAESKSGEGKAEVTAKADANSGDGKARAKANTKSDDQGSSANAEADSKSESDSSLAKASSGAHSNGDDLHAQASAEAQSKKGNASASAEASSSKDTKGEASQKPDDEKSQSSPQKRYSIQGGDKEPNYFPIHQSQKEKAGSDPSELSSDNSANVQHQQNPADYQNQPEESGIESATIDEEASDDMKPHGAIEVDGEASDGMEGYEDAESGDQPDIQQGDAGGATSPEHEKEEPEIEQDIKANVNAETLADVESENEMADLGSESEDVAEEGPLIIEPEVPEPRYVVYESGTVIEGVQPASPTYIEEPEVESTSDEQISEAVEDLVTEIFAHLDDDAESPSEVIEPEDTVTGVIEVFEETTDVIRPTLVDELESSRNTPEPVDTTVLAEEIEEHRGLKRRGASILAAPAKKLKSVAGKLNPLHWFTSSDNSRPSSAESNISVPELDEVEDDSMSEDASYDETTSDYLDDASIGSDVESEGTVESAEQGSTDNVVQEIESNHPDDSVSLPAGLEAIEPTAIEVTKASCNGEPQEEDESREATDSAPGFIDQLGDAIIDDVADKETEKEEADDEVSDEATNEVANEIVNDAVLEASEEVAKHVLDEAAEPAEGDENEDAADDIAEQIAKQIDEEVADDLIEKAASNAAEADVLADDEEEIAENMEQGSGGDIEIEEADPKPNVDIDEFEAPTDTEQEAATIPSPPKNSRPWSAASLESMSQLDDSVPALPQFNLIRPTLERLASANDEETPAPEVVETKVEDAPVEDIEEPRSPKKDPSSVSEIFKILEEKINEKIEKSQESKDDQAQESKDEQVQEPKDEQVQEPKDEQVQEAKEEQIEEPMDELPLEKEENIEEPVASPVKKRGRGRPRKKPFERVVKEEKPKKHVKPGRPRKQKITQEEIDAANDGPRRVTSGLRRKDDADEEVAQDEDAAEENVQPEAEPAEQKEEEVQREEEANEDEKVSEPVKPQEPVDAPVDSKQDTEAASETQQPPAEQPSSIALRVRRRAAAAKHDDEDVEKDAEVPQPAPEAPPSEAAVEKKQDTPAEEAASEKEPEQPAQEPEAPAAEPPKRRTRGRKKKAKQLPKPEPEEEPPLKTEAKDEEPAEPEQKGTLQPGLAKKVKKEEDAEPKVRAPRTRRSTRQQKPHEEPVPSSPPHSPNHLAPGFEPEQHLSPTKRRGSRKIRAAAQSSPTAEFSPPMPRLRTASGSKWQLDLLDHPALRTRSKSPIKRTIQELSLDMEEEQPKRRRRNVRKHVQEVDAEEKEREEEGRGRRRRRD